MAQKPVLKFPGTSYLIDGPYINVGSVIVIWLFSFFVILTLALALSWHEMTISGHVLFPLPTNNRPPAYHVLAFYKMWLGKFLPMLRGDDYRHYTSFISWLGDRGELGRLGWRWLLSSVLALYGATTLAISAWKPVRNEIQTRGRVLVEGEDAYHQLKADWVNQHRREAQNHIAPAFMLETDNGYLPSQPDTYRDLKPREKLAMPDGQRRPHFLFAAGSRRGKTQLVLKRIWEFYLRIQKGERIKVLIVDTPKADYSRYIPVEQMTMIAPQDLHGQAWDIGNDLDNKISVEEFWKGKIPDADKGDPFWTNAPRSLGAGANVVLVNTCGKDWGLNNLVRLLKMPAEEQEPLIRQHYPEALQIIQMGETTLSSVMGTLESYTKDLLQLAEIWDGYQYKHDINQLSVRLLKDEYDDNLLSFTQKLLPMFDEAAEGNAKPIIKNIHPNLVLRGIVKGLNRQHGNTDQGRWQWATLAELLSKSYRDIFLLAGAGMSVNEKQIFVPATAQMPVCNFAQRMQDSDITFSSDQQMVAFTREVFSTHKQADYITRALIRHYGYESPWQEIARATHTWLSGGHEAVFDIITQNLSSHELSSLFNDNDHATLLAGITPILQWFHVWDVFEGKERFSLKEWIYDENPNKKFLVIKTSGQFSSLTTPLVRGLLFYAKGLIDDDGFLDDKDAGFVRQFYILMDEFQALGNIKDFIEGALERFASKGVTVLLAVQDLSQLVKVYSQEFVDFLMSNTGNLFFIGSNAGKTAEIISNAIGKKWFKKLHTSITYQESGKSQSQNWQEHEAFVMTPDEINSKLGLDINGYPQKTFQQWLFREKPTGLPIRYLYLPGNMPKAYLLSTPVCGYKAVTKPKPADWRNPDLKPKPNKVDINAIIDGGGPTDDFEQEKKPSNRWVPAQSTLDMDLDDIEQWESQPAEEDYQVDHDDEDGKILNSLMLKSERQAIYILPPEEESLTSDVAKDLMIEQVIDSTALSALKHTTETLLGSSTSKTANKQKFDEEMEKVRFRNLEKHQY